MKVSTKYNLTKGMKLNYTFNLLLCIKIETSSNSNCSYWFYSEIYTVILEAVLHEVRCYR